MASLSGDPETAAITRQTRGILYCECGTRMRGEAHLQRGTERRYYRCPTLGCRTRRYPADLIEGDVLISVADGVLPASVIDAARTELRQLLETPEVAGAGKQRARLITRLEKLKDQHAWGDLNDAVPGQAGRNEGRPR